MRWLLGALVLLSACNQVFGVEATGLLDADLRPDRDGDEVADDEDLCIAGTFDQSMDADMDTVANVDDGCPLDVDQVDSDLDTIPDVCDPFPATSGDRKRCTMTFTDVDLNVALWEQRADEPGWMTAQPYPKADGDALQGILATEGILGPKTVSVAVTGVIFKFGSLPTRRLRIWLRFPELGCELRGDNLTTTIAVVHGATETATVFAPELNGSFAEINMRATFEPARTGTPNVACAISLQDLGDLGVPRVGSVQASFAIPPGRFGFTSDGAGAHLASLVIFDRDDAPPLP